MYDSFNYSASSGAQTMWFIDNIPIFHSNNNRWLNSDNMLQVCLHGNISMFVIWWHFSMFLRTSHFVRSIRTSMFVVYQCNRNYSSRNSPFNRARLSVFTSLFFRSESKIYVRWNVILTAFSLNSTWSLPRITLLLFPSSCSRIACHWYDTGTDSACGFMFAHRKWL